MYRLASHLGIWNVFGLLKKISPEQVDEWEAFDELEPLGMHRLYAMLALHGSHLAAIHGCDIPPERFHPHAESHDDEPMSNEEFSTVFSRL